MTAGFERKNIRLPASRYRGRGLYFVTLCFDRRRRLGTNPRTAIWLIVQLREHAARAGFFVHAYCIMPDHVHLLVAGSADDSDLGPFIIRFKQETGAAFASRTRKRLWQFKYYDHILRSSDVADRVACYIWMNPVRKGICRAPAEYPYLGSFTKIGMRMLRGAVAPEWVPPWKGSRRTAASASTRNPPGKPGVPG